MKSQRLQKTIKSNSTSVKRDRDSTFQLMSWWKKDTVRNAKVMVVGAGALGNEVLKNLALLNIGHLFIVDFDEIEYDNLSRSVLFRESDCGQKKCEVAAKRLREINPNIRIQTLVGDVSAEVGLGVFRQMDVVVGCVDNRLARLFINRACHKVSRTWVDGAIQDIAGHIYVYKPSRTCYECTLTQQDKALIERQLSCQDIAFFHEEQGRIATTPISSSIIGAIQAQEALKAINGDETVQMLEHFIYYEGRSNTVLQVEYPSLKELCQSHFTYGPIVEAPLSCQMTVGETLQWLSEQFNDPSPEILLDNPLILEVTTQLSEITTEITIVKPLLKGRMIKQFQKIPGEALVLTKWTEVLDARFPHQGWTLQQCGIPAFHILQVLTDTGYKFLELTTDKTFINFQ